MEMTQKLLLVLVIGAILIAPASALSLAFADSTLVGDHDVLIMAANGTLLWEGNTTGTYSPSAAVLNESTTLLIHLRPESKNVIETPYTLMDEIASQVEANLIPIIMIGIIGMILWGRK